MGVGEQGQQRDVLAFYALVGFAAVMYAVPGEWISALAPLRLALLTSGLAAGLMALRRLGRAEPLYFDGARGLALLGFSGLAFASVAWSVHPELTRFTGIELLKLTAIYLTIINVITSGRRLAMMCGAMVLGSIVTSIGVIDWYRTGVDMVEGYRSRWVGVYADPNHMAMNMAMVVPLAVAFLARKESGWLMRVACALAAVLSVMAIVLSHSRGGFIGLSVAMGVWAIREKRRIQALVVGALLALGLVLFAPKSFWQRNETVASFHEDASAMGRVYAWQVASRISLDKPLLGVGAGGFRYAWPLYAPPEARRAYVAHNIFLDVIGELGFLGLTLFLVFAGGATGGAFAASKDSQMGWLARALAASMAGYLVCDLFSGYILSAHLYVLFGLAASAHRIAQTRAETALVVQRMPAADKSAAAWEGSGHAA
ncbi:O-antigen ligase family protein [Stigmatella aurantiaca]|uniref:O-antigen polymerase family protein n=1 Tax=Stigmatella aurantiaca (strain DW4/3-1) TaxID=378806 RepID=Q08UF1_STIAD|nr:O-antigen ligase family protein [Stigmatella aurantiaca]ADO72832.1 O-antigen polymerase family protein [Stigmatella aurantiaca DW4/3-1]EAU64109.1 O-antigen polymerase, putative [Stigmatella aurantiaca DW4/3-1]